MTRNLATFTIAVSIQLCFAWGHVQQSTESDQLLNHGQYQDVEDFESFDETPRSSRVYDPEAIYFEVRNPGNVDSNILTERAQMPGLDYSIIGSLRALDHSQVRDRPGRQNSDFDWHEGDGCRSGLKISVKGHPRWIPIPFFKNRNLLGSWSSYIHLGSIAISSKVNKKVLVGAQDWNLFVTAFSAYPLFFFDDSRRSKPERFVTRMRREAVQCMKQFKRGSAFNFWPPLEKDPGRRGPVNINPRNLSVFAKLGMTRIGKFLGAKRIDPKMFEWAGRILNREENQEGAEAFFNIPNDADDTAVALALQFLHAQEYDPESTSEYYRHPGNFKLDDGAINEVLKYRDLTPERSREYDNWAGKETGSFLVWLKDASSPTFSSPITGVMPGGENLIDETVNANVLFALALLGKNNEPGYAEAQALIRQSSESGHWHKEWLFYPNIMAFPYAVSRAYRDGRARGVDLEVALGKLMIDILEMGQKLALEQPDLLGAFPGGGDSSYEMSTALALTFLLNAGNETARNVGKTTEYTNALLDGIRFLIGKSRPLIRKHEGKKQSVGLVWAEGVFFSGDPQNIAVWVAQSLTTAFALEAFTKFRLGYDLGGPTLLEGRALVLH